MQIHNLKEAVQISKQIDHLNRQLAVIEDDLREHVSNPLIARVSGVEISSASKETIHQFKVSCLTDIHKKINDLVKRLDAL